MKLLLQRYLDEANFKRGTFLQQEQVCCNLSIILITPWFIICIYFFYNFLTCLLHVGYSIHIYNDASSTVAAWDDWNKACLITDHVAIIPGYHTAYTAINGKESWHKFICHRVFTIFTIITVEADIAFSIANNTKNNISAKYYFLRPWFNVGCNAIITRH